MRHVNNEELVHILNERQGEVDALKAGFPPFGKVISLSNAQRDLDEAIAELFRRGIGATRG